jgi:transcription elongation factor GreA-like protein
MSARFESVLLDTVNACLEEPSLYKECLRILGDYLQIKQKCLHNEDKAHALLRTLMENLKTDYESLSTLEAYYRLLSKLKEKVVLSMCP